MRECERRHGVRHSTLSAVVLTGALVGLLRGRVLPPALVAIPCALFGLAVGDGRAAMGGAAIGVGYALLHGAWLRWAALSVPAGFLALSAFAALLPRSWALALARTGDAGEIAAGNGRAEIWQAVFDYVLAHPLAMVAGMGQFGQVTADIVRDLSHMTAFQDASQLSMHNVGVQALIDGGLLGLGLTTLWLFRACQGLERFPVAAAMMLTMLIAGVFDVWMTHYSDEGFFACLILGMAGLVQVEGEAGERRQKRRRHREYP